MKIEVEDSIFWYYSPKAQRTYPVYVFGGDTDMATEGKLSLTSLVCEEVVVTMAAVGEWPDNWERIDERVNRSLGRDDFRSQRLRPARDGRPGWCEPVDIHDSAGTARFRREQRVADFLRRGGRVIEVLE